MRISTLGLIFSCSVLLACAGDSAMPLAGAARQEGVVFYVEHQGEDHRNLNFIITDVLKSRGLEVSTGVAGAAPEETDFVVSYVDHWAWDMRTYMREIAIEVRRADSPLVVAMSRSHRDSLSAMGETYEGLVREATNRLLDGEGE